MNGYLVPANAKRGTLIFNIFRPFDLIMFATGVVVSLLVLAIVHSDNTIAILLSCLPAGITGLLVVPIPNYHNVLCVIQCIIQFYTGGRNYQWRGWCFYEKFAVDDKK